MVSGQAQKARLHVSQDGHIRMPLSELSSLTLTHFRPGLDDDAAEHNLNDVTLTTISGYTEWFFENELAITVGWDWYLDLTASVPRYVQPWLAAH